MEDHYSNKFLFNKNNKITTTIIILKSCDVVITLNGLIGLKSQLEASWTHPINSPILLPVSHPNTLAGLIIYYKYIIYVV